MTATDLAAWSAGRSPDSAVAEATVAEPASTAREAELGSRLDWLTSVRATGPLRPSPDLVAQRLVADLGVARVVVWGLDGRNQRFVRLTSAGQSQEGADATVPLRDVGAALTMLQAGLQPLDSRPTPMTDPGDHRWQLVAPLRVDRQLLGLVTIAGASGQAELTTEAMGWANLLVSLIADTQIDRHRAAEEHQREAQFQTLIDALPDPAAIADETGRILVANAALRGQFGLTLGSLAVGVDLPSLLGQVEQLSGRGGKRSVVPRLRAVLAGRESTTLPLTLTASPGQGHTQLIVVPVVREGDADDSIVASLVRVRQSARPERPADIGLPRGPGIAGGVIEVGRLVDFVTSVGAGAHLDDVLVAGVDRLRDLFGASAGSILLRREDGMLVRLSPSGFDETSTLRTMVDPLTLPSARRAIAERRTTVVRRSTANDAEVDGLDRAHSDGGLVIPLLLGEEVLGLAVLAFFAEPTDLTDEQTDLATSLGRYLAAAVTNARNWDRWGVAQRYLLTVIDQLPQGVVVVDATDGSLAVANRAADDLWGVNLRGTADTDDVSAMGDVVRETAESGRIAGLLRLHDADGQPFAAGELPMERTLRHGERRLGEPLTVVRPDGSTVRVVGNHVPIVADDGRTVSGVGVFQNIEQLREVDRVKDDFLSVVAHELRNPLTSLRGNMQLVQRRMRRQDGPARAEDVERLGGLISQTDRISELLGRLLDVSRVDLDRIVLECGDLDATDLVAGSVESARGLATRHTIVLTGPEKLPVSWDRVRIEQVIGNLLSNAIKYTGAGEIRVRLTASDDGLVEISVADEGDGISDHIKPRVFERYFRGAQGLSGPDGLGIGLYISSRIVAAHQGTLTVDDAPGGGAVFTVRLPADARTVALAGG